VEGLIEVVELVHEDGAGQRMVVDEQLVAEDDRPAEVVATEHRVALGDRGSETRDAKVSSY
jgi:hypothetical protein